MPELRDSIIHRGSELYADSSAIQNDSAHIPRWRFDNLQQVSGMYQLDSLPVQHLTNFHKKIFWKEEDAVYIKRSKFYHKELPAVRDGEVGVPVEYSISNDSFLSMGLFMCILFSILITARSWNFTCFQIKNLFSTPRENSAILRETSSEMRYQIYFSFIGVLMLALFSYTMSVYTLQDGEGFSVGDYQLIGIYVMVFLLYRGLCSLLEALVLPVYFKESQRMMWAGNKTFLIALQGALLLPLSLVMIYLHLRIETALTITVSVVAVTFLLRIYKAYLIFFRKNGAFLQFFLYLCTLKVVPLVLLTGGLLFIVTYLKINI